MSYRMDSIKKETKLNVQPKPCILMKQYVKLHITVVILTVKKSQVMATYLEKSE